MRAHLCHARINPKADPDSLQIVHELVLYRYSSSAKLSPFCPKYLLAQPLKRVFDI